MLESLLEVQKNALEKQNNLKKYGEELKNCVDILNKHSILCLTGIKFSGKKQLACKIVQQTGQKDSYFYFNPHLDTYKLIKNCSDLTHIMDLHIRIYGMPKIVILEDINLIDSVKDFIQDLYKTKRFKIIIIGNNIHIPSIENIEIYPLFTQSEKHVAHIYGGIPEVHIAPNCAYKEFLLQALTSELLEKEIYQAYHIKNHGVFRTLMNFLAHTDTPLSLRTLHSEMESRGVILSLQTLIDYIQAGVTTKILRKQALFDCKKDAVISGNVLYQFGDIGIRNTLGNMFCEQLRNYLYLFYIKNKCEVYYARHGVLYIDIYTIRDNQRRALIITQSSNAHEIEKIARKLAKLPNIHTGIVLAPHKNFLSKRKFQARHIHIFTLPEFLAHEAHAGFR